MKVLLLLLTIVASAPAFVVPHGHRVGKLPLMASQTDVNFSPIFDFTKADAVESFDRIDDAIMGGISTSSIRSSPDGYASWSGICRVDGGGFCGTRTLPFESPLKVGDAKGFYLDCRLVSDDEPERRVWKISTRSEESRGEELYQSEFKIPKGRKEWSRIQLPFDGFQKVRGARFVPDAPKMDVSNGLFQVGMTMSKFLLAQNMTGLDNFRPGFFELQVKSIGVYSEDKVNVATPKTLSADEMKNNRPLLVKVLLRVAKLFFSEEANRRKSAMKILREKRSLSRPRAILFGIGIRSAQYGRIVSTLQAARIVTVDSVRTVYGSLLRYGVFLPLLQVAKLKKAMKKKKAQS